MATAMARVVFPDHLLKHTQGTSELEVSAESYRAVVRALNERWPGIEDVLAKTAVAIDGQIYQDAWLEPVEPKSEVFFLHRIEGG